MPATSSNVTRFCSPGVTRRAVERPKPRMSVARNERPLSGGSALTTTPFDSSCLVRFVVSTNDGTSVLKRSTLVAFSPGGVKVAFFLRSPWIVSPCDEISWTLPAWTWLRKNGEYGTCVRCAGPPVMSAATKLIASSARTTAMIRRLSPNIGGLGGGGAPRPSGAGSTRQPLRSSVCGGRCGLEAAGEGSGTIGSGETVQRPAGLSDQRAEIGLEAGVAHGGRLHAVDLDAVARCQARHRAEHREPVVAVGGDRAAAQAARAVDLEPVLGRLDPAPERAQAVDDGRDAVGLLDAQLLRAAHDRAALREAAEQRDERELVDRERDLVGLHDGRSKLAGADLEVADRVRARDRVAGLLLELAVDARAHAAGDADEPGARPVRARAADDDVRAGDQQRRGDREGGRRRVAGDGDRVDLETVGRGGLDPQLAPAAADGGPRGGEHPLGVVAAPAPPPDRS